MKVVRAKTAGFCMGVSLALKKLNTSLDDAARARRVCTLGPIIHNPQVLAEYEARGVVCAADASQLLPDDYVIIRAHGLARQEEEAVRAAAGVIVDATCPRVKKARMAIEQATKNGATLLLFGEANHPEVRGLISYTHGAAYVFSNLREFDSLVPPHGHDCVLASQTTQDRKQFMQMEKILRKRLERLSVLSTICDATRSRQKEARDIASSVDVMVIVGGRQSGNTRRLADIAALSGIEIFHVETPKELDSRKFAKKNRAGLTAGASTPKSLIDATERWLVAL
ncbi:MAG: hydroxymethylbutenyl pyrophosphate reductase [Candidatus Desulfovibrio kirbyi]|uniref:4-hydroxy-3-methylbut-2-enyl diphosphate reductase n=1 Tax=Candidatus Desulfovibrio kirbyi TaxID=2696086 RepID=A0A6L2R441_9BACT|nr:MAG: hydroxymethylbutenyl pyrophosphate reductase [Candidatus Desulfovibrio kirbyi]